MVFIPPCVLCLALYLYYLLFSRDARAFTFQKAFSAVPKGRFRYALSAKSGIVSGNSTDIYQGSYRNHSFQAMNLSRIDPVICHGDSRQPSRILSCCSPCFSSHNFHAATIHALHLPLQKEYHIGRQQSMIFLSAKFQKLM